MPKIVTLGETMALIRSNSPGHQGSRSQMTFGFGGAESNLSVALTRLGNEVTWFSQLGSDAAGRMIATELRGEGVDVIARRLDEAPTGLMMKTTGLAGIQEVTYYRSNSAATLLKPSDIPADIFTNAKLFHTSGISLAISTSSRETALAAIKKAKEQGILVSFDVNHRTRLWSANEAAPHYRSAIAQADIVFAGRAEAALVTGLDPSADPLELLVGMQELTSAVVILKEGTEGSWAIQNSELIHSPAVEITAVDTVGAGDGFAAGFIDEFLKSTESNRELFLTSCLASGNRVGAFACLNEGDWEGYPLPAQLKLLDTAGAGETVNR